jgi:hypothetical protein
MRRTKTVAIKDEGRDKGKSFLITEMSAFQAEWWAIRALILMGNAGVAVPGTTMESGLAGLAFLEQTKGAATAVLAVGLRLLPGVDPDALKPLLDEMMACVQYVPPMGPPQPLEDGIMCQVADYRTLFKLRADVLELTLGFSLAGGELTTDTTPPAPAS